MLGAAGMIAPEILGRAGLIPQETAVVWFKSVSNLTPKDKWARLERSRGLSCLPRSSNLRPVRAPLDSYLVSAQSIGTDNMCVSYLFLQLWHLLKCPFSFCAQGVFPPAGGYNYWADAYTLFILELVLMGFAEHKR
jgi:hypothetical protein